MSGFFYRARQRSGHRRAVQTECHAVTDPHFEFVGDRVLDLSLGGAFISSRIYPAVGEELLLSLRIPKTRIWIDAEAEVARVVRGRRRRDETRGVAIRFKRLDTTTRALLQGSLEGLPPPTPARTLRRDYAKTVRMIGIAPW
ncbi:MAG: PilZ domain-containing protein [Myxococcota bacterium]